MSVIGLVAVVYFVWLYFSLRDAPLRDDWQEGDEMGIVRGRDER